MEEERIRAIEDLDVEKRVEVTEGAVANWLRAGVFISRLR